MQPPTDTSSGIDFANPDSLRDGYANPSEGPLQADRSVDPPNPVPVRGEVEVKEGATASAK
jgi:hypothetical protein